MTWIDFVPFEDADGRLKTLYDRYKRPNDTVSNIITAQSLRPHLLEGHMALYRAVLGHTANALPLWFLEAVGVYVSALNGCAYCIGHHGHYGGLAFKGEAGEWRAIVDALLEDRVADAFDGKHLALLRYAAAVTRDPASITEQTIHGLRDAGANDGEILEVNQVAGYFAYANRTVLGLGITLDGEIHAD